MIVPTVLRPECRPWGWPTAIAGGILDPVGVGLVELREELARVRREGLDVAPLPLGVERVEGQRALARSADARHDDQPVERQVEVDPLEVMGANTAQLDRSRAVGLIGGRTRRRAETLARLYQRRGPLERGLPLCPGHSRPWARCPCQRQRRRAGLPRSRRRAICRIVALRRGG